MRVPRTVFGLLLVVAGSAALAVAGAGWTAMAHRDSDDRFTATLTSVHGDGYAIVVPDLADLRDRYGNGLLGEGSLRLRPVMSSVPVVLAIGPAAEVERYLTGVARTTITTVGQADGAQPVTLTETDGRARPAAVLKQSFWSATSTSELEWDGGPGPVSLVVMRADGATGLDVTLAASHDAGWLTTITGASLVAGVLGVLGGLLLVFWPVASKEMVLVLESHRMVDFADRIAERVGGARPRRKGQVRPTTVQRTRLHDLTGEFVPIESSAYPAPTPRPTWPERDQVTSPATSPVNNEPGSATGSPAPNQRQLAQLNPRWRRNSRFEQTQWNPADPPRAAEPDEAGVDKPRTRGIDDPTGESPYIHTAT